jgi:hypothetical protein
MRHNIARFDTFCTNPSSRTGHKCWQTRVRPAITTRREDFVGTTLALRTACKSGLNQVEWLQSARSQISLAGFTVRRQEGIRKIHEHAAIRSSSLP